MKRHYFVEYTGAGKNNTRPCKDKEEAETIYKQVTAEGKPAIAYYLEGIRAYNIFTDKKLTYSDTILK